MSTGDPEIASNGCSGGVASPRTHRSRCHSAAFIARGDGRSLSGSAPARGATPTSRSRRPVDECSHVRALVRASRDLPVTMRVGVGLANGKGRKAPRLRCSRGRHLRGDVVADARRLAVIMPLAPERRRPTRRVRRSRRPSNTPAVGLHRVDVGREPAGGLRLPGRDQLLHARARRGGRPTLMSRAGPTTCAAWVKMSYE